MRDTDPGESADGGGPAAGVPPAPPDARAAGPDGERAADDDAEGDGGSEDDGDWEGRSGPDERGWCGIVRPESGPPGVSAVAVREAGRLVYQNTAATPVARARASSPLRRAVRRLCGLDGRGGVVAETCTAAREPGVAADVMVPETVSGSVAGGSAAAGAGGGAGCGWP